jgi:hypothetical protein
MARRRDAIKEYYAEDLKDSIIITVQEMLLCLISRVVRKEDQKETEGRERMKEIYNEVAAAIHEACNEALQASSKEETADMPESWRAFDLDLRLTELGERMAKTEDRPSPSKSFSSTRSSLATS